MNDGEEYFYLHQIHTKENVYIMSKSFQLIVSFEFK